MKKEVARKARQRVRKPHPKKRLLLEMGKTYISKGGFIAKIVYDVGGTMPYKGQWVGEPPKDAWCLTHDWFSVDGKQSVHGDKPHLDLVREYVPANSKRNSPGAKPTKKLSKKPSPLMVSEEEFHEELEGKKGKRVPPKRAHPKKGKR